MGEKSIFDNNVNCFTIHFTIHFTLYDSLNNNVYHITLVLNHTAEKAVIEKALIEFGTKRVEKSYMSTTNTRTKKTKTYYT